MAEVNIVISDEFKKFNDGDVLVYDKKNKCFTAVSIQSLTKKYIVDIKAEKVELENQLKKEIERYKFMADRFRKMTDEMLLRLGGGSIAFAYLYTKRRDRESERNSTKRTLKK